MEKTKLQPLTSDKIACDGMALLKSGKIRNHKLGNSSRIHTGEVEQEECRIYRDFLPSKNCCIVLELTGSECYE